MSELTESQNKKAKLSAMLIISGSPCIHTFRRIPQLSALMDGGITTENLKSIRLGLTLN